MNSRLNRYYENDDEVVNTRVHKNEELYREISKNEIDGYEVKSNATVLGENKNEIDVDKIKKILDTKYNEIPQRKSIKIEEEKEEEEKEEDTKEYDINVVLEKAKEQKEDNYEEERLKKVHNTQFDILKELNIDKPKENEDLEEENLKSLIDTIAFNESHNSSNANTNTSLDILSDLKGSGNTEVLTGLKEELNELQEDAGEDKKNTEEISEIKDEKISDLTNSFYTSSNALKQKDFEELDDDFADSVTVNGIFLKIVIVLIVIAFLVGIGLLIKSLFFS